MSKRILVEIRNASGELIPGYPFSFWSFFAPLTNIRHDPISSHITNANGKFVIQSPLSWNFAYGFVHPDSFVNWGTPEAIDSYPGINSPSDPQPYLQENTENESYWIVNATVKPVKPIIIAEVYGVAPNGYIRITHINDVTKYGDIAKIRYNTSNNYAGATEVSQSSSGTVIWSNTTVKNVDGTYLTTADFYISDIIVGKKYWFWMVESNDIGNSEVSEPVTASLLSSTYTLNIDGSVGGNLIGPSNCSNVISGTSCTVNFKPSIGSPISITANADTHYIVGDFTITPLVPFSINKSNSKNHTIIIVNNNEPDITVTVNFESEYCLLNLLIDKESFINEHGKIKLDIPNLGDNYSFGSKFIEIVNAKDNSPVTIYARPNNKYQVKEFIIDDTEIVSLTDSRIIPAIAGSRDVGINVSIEETFSRKIAVRFEEFVCSSSNFVTLNIDISGEGVTYPISGETFCIDDIVFIQAVPANGWAFSSWNFPSGSDYTLDGNNLLVTMTGDVNSGITANFVEVPVTVIVKDQVSTMFYCPSENYKDNIVSFDFINNNEDPSISNQYHFRVNFYNDIEKSKLIYSAFSLADNKRWFLNDIFFSQLSSEGLNVGLLETVSIVYDPEVLFSQITESQKPHLINDKTVVYEKPLICGIKYYVEIQAYELSTNSITTIGTIPLTLDCNRVGSYSWNYNKDKNNWLCSGQGKTDLKVCGGAGQAINSSVDSNLFGIFKIVWQGRKVFNDATGEAVRTNNIYSALWDSDKDVLYSSGQGLYDVLEMENANHPIVIKDPALNFYITGATVNNIKYKACGLKTCHSDDDPPSDTVDNNFEKFCYPGELTLLGSAYDKIKMRVYKEDVIGSLVVSDEKVVSVVNKKSIRLDVDGIAGAYAVRVKNMEDSDWGEWINIDNELLGVNGGDEHNNAYRIDNSRFLFNWDINRYNGLRRICCQVLTMYGISNTFCMEMLVNFEVPQHVFKFYTTDTRIDGSLTDTPPGNEFPIYNGQYILSLESPGLVLSQSNIATVYFDAIFSEPVYKDEANSIAYTTEDVKFNVVQQGINDLRNQKFTTITATKFSGQFDINQSDGIFNKDGEAFIEIIFSETSASEFCGFDERDKYNFINADDEEISNIDLLPEEVYQKYQRNRLSKAINIDKFRQNYDKDDFNFKFGDPGHYRK